MANSRFSRTYIDESKEKSTVDFPIREMTAASIASLLTELATLGTAINDLSLGVLVKSQAIQDSSPFAAAPPVDENAQRERKWLVRFQDTSNQRIGTVEIPVAKVVGLKIANSDQADLTAAAWLAFIAAFEATARSVDGNVVNVLDAVLVGRNL